MLKRSLNNLHFFWYRRLAGVLFFSVESVEVAALGKSLRLVYSSFQRTDLPLRVIQRRPRKAYLTWRNLTCRL